MGNTYKSVYHLKGNDDMLKKDNSEESKLKQIATFTQSTLRGKNLCIFIGSGCSLNEIPLMGTTMQTILKNPKNDKIIEYVDIFAGTGASKEFTNIEAFLNWLTSGVKFEKDQSKVDEIQTVIDEVKAELIATIIPISHDYYRKSKTLSNYINFYERVFSKRMVQDEKVSIFTTNYDLFNEYALSEIGIRYTTGFTTNILSTFDINQFRYRFVDNVNRYKDKWSPEGKEANLFKLHGSINWTQDNSGNLTETHDSSKKVIIYPTELKNEETSKSPYAILFREFANQLQKPNTTLIVLGYGFPDEHINDVIAQNLKNDDFNLVVYSDIDEENVKKFYEGNSSKQNFHLIGGDVKIEGKTPKLHYFEMVSELLLNFSDDNQGDNNTSEVVVGEEK